MPQTPPTFEKVNGCNNCGGCCGCDCCNWCNVGSAYMDAWYDYWNSQSCGSGNNGGCGCGQNNGGCGCGQNNGGCGNNNSGCGCGQNNGCGCGQQGGHLTAYLLFTIKIQLF